MNYEHLFIKTSLETAMKFSSAAAKHATVNINNEVNHLIRIQLANDFIIYSR